jgi:hypothetical protein
MKVDTHLNFGDAVYFKTDEEQEEFLVTGFRISPTGITYQVSHNGRERDAYDFEITITKKVVI